MKRIVIITIAIIAVLLLVGCFNCAEEEVLMEAGIIWGEVYRVDGNVISLNEVAPPGGLNGGNGPVIFRSGENGNGQRVLLDGDDALVDDDIAEGEYRIWEREEGEDGEFVIRQRIADAPEGERIRMAEENGEGGEMPAVQRTGNVREITVQQGVQVIVAATGDAVDISALERGNVIMVTIGGDGQVESIRLTPLRVN